AGCGLAQTPRCGLRAVPGLPQRALALRAARGCGDGRLPAHVRRPARAEALMILTQERMPQVQVRARFAAPTLQLLPAAVAENVRRMRTGGPVMAVVKADGYGHGALAVACAALDAGAEWLGVTDVSEGARLRDAGITAPVLAWLHPSGIDTDLAAAARIDVAVGSVEELAELIGAACAPIRVHLHLDTGMARGGCPVQDWPALLRLARQGRAAGGIEVVGVMGHLPQADLADPRADLPWVMRLRHARDTALRAGFAPLVTHLGATAAALHDPAGR